MIKTTIAVGLAALALTGCMSAAEQERHANNVRDIEAALNRPGVGPGALR